MVLMLMQRMNRVRHFLSMQLWRRVQKWHCYYFNMGLVLTKKKKCDWAILFYATAEKDTEMVQLLLQHGADVKEEDQHV